MNLELETFERLVHTRRHDAALAMLWRLLGALDSGYGSLEGVLRAEPARALDPAETGQHLRMRLVTAICALFAERGVRPPRSAMPRLFELQRWLAALFASTPLLNADPILRSLMRPGDGADAPVIDSDDLLKFCLLYFPESEVELDIDAVWRADPGLAVGLGLALLAPRFTGSASAHHKREILLPWLTDKLALIEDVEALPLGILHDVYMHCSYADRADKHAIKASINRVVGRLLERGGMRAAQPRARVDAPGCKPVLLVVVEWFHADHSIYRTHSRAIEAAREHFHVLGAGLAATTDAAGRAVFDEFVELRPGAAMPQLEQLREVAQRSRAQILYMPSVGMFPLTMLLANLRLTPLVAMGLGHPATTHAGAIDLVVVEEDFVAEPGCFSETLLMLPRDAMPYRAPPDFAREAPAIRDKPEVVQVCVAASAMKINPGLLDACREIAERCSVPVHFHFTVAFAHGVLHEQVSRVVRRRLGMRATVHSHRDRPRYMDILRACDLFIDPFPFGNTNGLIDCIEAGLIGICMVGPEVHQRIDQALMQRLSMPAWLAAPDRSCYVEAAVRLIEQHELRGELRRRHSGAHALRPLFHGRPHVMARRFLLALDAVQAGLEHGVARHRRP